MKKRILSLIMTVVMLLTMCISSTTALAAGTEVQTATLTINYYLQSAQGNMIHEPYIAELVSGSEYEVESPQIDGFTLENPDQSTVSGALNNDTTVNVYYTYTEETYLYTVIYEGYDSSTGTTVTLDTVTGYAPADTKVAIEYRDFWGYDKEETDDMSLTVTADGNASKTLRYTLKDAPYIIFRTQGSYIQPITAKADSDISEQIKNIQPPTRPGYDFAGWEYEGKTYENSEELAQALSKMPTVLTYVNAEWKPGEANYTVLTWFQNAEDDDYTLYTNVETRRGTVGATVTETQEDIAKGENDENEAGNAYFGFNYSHCEDTEIAPDGTAVLNLYYDREIWKINYMEKDGETIWKTIEGKYMSLIGDKLISQEDLKAHYGSTFAYMAKTKGGNDSAMLEKFENSESDRAGYGEQNIFPYFNTNIYQYQIQQFSYDPNTDDITERILIQTSYIYYYMLYAKGVILVPPEGFTWKGGWWKTAPTEAGLAKAQIKSNPDGKDEDGRATFYNFYQYAEIFMERDKSTLKYISNGEIIQQIDNVPYEKNVDLSLVPTNGEEHMQFEGWYVNPNLMNFMEPLSKCQMPAGDLSLYAKWGPSDCTVTFDTQGGSEVPSQTVKYNSSAEEPEQPTRPGYIFTGWYTKPEGGSIWAFEQTVAEDTTLYAHWRESVTAPFTINHVIEGEQEPFYVQTGKSTIGDTIYATALSSVDEHYPENVYVEPASAKSQSIVLKKDEENTVTFIYKRIGEKQYTVSYLDRDTKEPLKGAKEVTTYNTVATEFPAEIAGYTCTDEDGYETKVLQTDEKNEIIFYYEPKADAVGGLTVTKTVSGDQADPTENFNFQITLDDTSINGDYGDVTFNDGIADFTLHHNQSIVVSGLPVGTGYEVEELQENQAEETAAHVHDAECGYVEARAGSPCNHVHDDNCGYAEAIQGTPCNHVHDETCGFTAPVEAQPCTLELESAAQEDAGYEVSSVYAEGVIGVGNIDVRFNNHKGDGTRPNLETGCLTVTNRITGNDADLNDRFDFTIELADKTINGQYGEVIFNNGVAEFSLGHQEQITIQDLPAGISYTVSEVDSQGYTVTAQGENGEIVFDETVKAEFVNTRNKSGGGGAHHPEYDPDDDDDQPEDEPEDEPDEVIDEEVPLAETPWLNTEDHYAYIVGYPEDYVTGEPTEDESRWPVKPQANITRAEVATIFFRLLTDEARDQFWMTTNNFPDVQATDWYNNAISTMVNAGIIQGYEDGTFRPNNNITRAEFAAIASRFMSSGYDVEEDLFTDIANHWARDNINDAAMTQWIHGYPDGTFRPDQAITRAEAVTLVNNVLQRKPDADHLLDSMIKWPDNMDTSAWYYEAIQEATNSHDYDLFEGAEYETWTALQENRDWAALEKDWVNAHRTGGEVM